MAVRSSPDAARAVEQKFGRNRTRHKRTLRRGKVAMDFGLRACASMIILRFAILPFLSPAVAAEYRPRFVTNMMQICVERFEDQGSANVRPVTAILSGELEIRMLGGTAACGYFPAGTHSIQIEWVAANSNLSQ